MAKKRWLNPKLKLLAGLLASSFFVSAAFAQAAKGNEKLTPSASSSRNPAAAGAHRFVPSELTPKQKSYYEAVWGVDIVGVKLVSSGLMVRFTYRVVNANRAKALNDKRANPMLIDEKTGLRLIVPTMEKVGQLRQSSPPENGREYWMVFSNNGEPIKAGSRVDVVIGKFRANGLIVR
jgi:hypothetical protein